MAELKTKRTDEQMEQARHNAQVATGVKRRIKDFFDNEYGWSHADCWQTAVYEQVELSEKCCWFSCDNPAQKRIAINQHGCVREIDVCEKHKSLHGAWTE